MQTSSDRHEYPAHWEADVVLRDGGTARIRPITADDAERLVSFYEQVSDESKYYRFFAPYPRLSAKDVHRFTHHDFVDRVGLAATVGDDFIGTVRYDRIGAGGRPATGEEADEAEVAFLVQDAHQGRGVASALLEHIAAVARERGIRRFAAEVLPANTKMIKVFTDAGYTQKRSFEDGVVRLEFDLEPTDRSLAVQYAREQRAEARSVQRLLAPGAVAVIGTGRAPGGVGRSILGNIRDAGFTGRLYAVNGALPEGEKELDGVPAFRSVRDIDGPVDLAVVAVPAERVPEVVAECGEHEVQGLVVVSAGYAESGPEGRERQRALVRQARSYGMRIIGPNSFGVINTSPEVRLNASLAPDMPRAGRIGLFAQSGAIGVALLSRLHRRGGGVTGVTGLSTFVSSGNRADVSGNDLLQYWETDPHTDVVLLYLESFGNPRKFARLARRLARTKPVVAVKSGRHAVRPQLAATSTDIDESSVQTLFEQAGVVRVDTLAQLFDTALVFANQPLPAGPRIGIVGNSSAIALLAADTARAQGLRLGIEPVDVGSQASPEKFAAAVGEALASPEVDALVVVFVPPVAIPGTAYARALRETVTATPTTPEKPIVSTFLAAEGVPDELAVTDEDGTVVFGSIPSYPSPERAVNALARVVRYAEWRRRPQGSLVRPEGLHVERAQTLVRELTEDRNVVLHVDDMVRLLDCYGIDVVAFRVVSDVDEAVAAAEELGFPVTLKAFDDSLRDRPDLAGVRLDLSTPESVRVAYRDLREVSGRDEVYVQRMAPKGLSCAIGLQDDPSFGTLVSFGLSGVVSTLLGDQAFRAVPLTDVDAATLVREPRTAPLLTGYRGDEPADLAALQDLVLRVSALAEDHPEVRSLSLDPVLASPEGAFVTNARIVLGPPPSRPDTGPRRLRQIVTPAESEPSGQKPDGSTA